MGVGYAAFSTVLNINGTAEISSSWDVEITNVETIEQIGDATNKEEPTFTYDTANLRASFIYPGDSIKYRITVSNLGSLNAVIDSAKLELDDQNVLIHEIEGIDAGETLNAGSSKSFTLKITFNEEITSSPDIGNVVATLKLNYLQAGGSSSFSNAEGSTSDTITINSLNLTSSETSITAKINSTPSAYKYYYSLDEDVWYESSFDEYTINNLKPNTNYTVYVKAEDSSGEVVKYSKSIKTTDTTKPNLKIEKGNSTLDEEDTVNHITYEYYKSLYFDVTATDNDQVNSVKYCVSSSECTPNTNLTLTDNKGSIQMPNANGGQVLCVTATDKVGNEIKKCTDEYKVDGEKPTLTDMDYLSSGNTVSITLSGGSDTHSGVYKYLFIKSINGVETSVRVDNPNYTFTNLEDGHYTFTSKVVDKAGNESDVEIGKTTKSLTVSTTNICGNTITDFGNCIIASNSGLTVDDENATSSKALIQAKAAPSFTVTSPSVTYGQSGRSSSTTTNNSTTLYRISKDVTFDSTTGYYTIENYTSIDKISDLSTITSSNSYYTCNHSTTTSCTTLYEMVGATFNGTTYSFTEYTHSSSVSGYDTTTPGTGMYATTDYDGNYSYYFRGTGLANYVHFANKYWRIIRVNGDGTVRMIYDGTSKHKDGESSDDRRVATNAFNTRYDDNARVGYMYGNADNYTEQLATHRFTYTNLSATNKFYFATSYTPNTSAKTFTLSGTKVQSTIKNYKTAYAGDGNTYYTCFSTSSTASCNRLLKVYAYSSDIAMSVYPIEFVSSSYSDAHSNLTPSAMKTFLEGSGTTTGWYANNLSGYTSKLSGSTVFCNNRQISNYGNGTYTNQGYGIFLTLYGYTRFWAWTGSNGTSSISPTLSCPQTDDRFTVDSSKGNGLQAAPVGLITADEVSIAGGKTGTQNTMYYLYTGHVYWTMSPSRFNNLAVAGEMNVAASGELASSSVNYGYGVRPVINLNPANLTFSGSGTYDDPYEVS